MGSFLGRQFGDYRLTALIGTGGMGEVYVGEHALLGKKYAVKVLNEALSSNPEFITRFYDEARVMAEFRHSNIVRVITMGQAGGALYLVMDYVTGPDGVPVSLQEVMRMKPGGCGDPVLVAFWAAGVAAGLGYAHQRGVLHRDVKPANVLIDESCRAMITDFGLAKLAGDWLSMPRGRNEQPARGATASAGGLDAAKTVVLTAPGTRGSGSPSGSSSGELLGTYDYMAPEQRGEGGEVDARTDLYALGVMTYRLLTGRRPVGVAAPPSKLVKDLPTQWDEITAKCMEYDPSNRYQSAEALIGALKPLLAELESPGQARETGPAHEQAPPPPTKEAPISARLLGEGAVWTNLPAERLTAVVCDVLRAFGAGDVRADPQSRTVTGKTGFNWQSIGQVISAVVQQVPGGSTVTVSSRPKRPQLLDNGRGAGDVRKIAGMLLQKLGAGR